MVLKLYFHPLSSFCQKALTALYENDTPFVPHIVDLAPTILTELGLPVPEAMEGTSLY